MGKNIIICADGTGNRGGVGRGTNVWRLYNALDLNSSKPRQVAKYHDGVGTAKTLLHKIAGAALGWGLTAHIRSLYRYVALNYEPGDQVYLFGFSRGAYTVRVLHNILYYVGVPENPVSFTPQQLDVHIKQVIKAYKKGCKQAHKHNKLDFHGALQQEFKALISGSIEDKASFNDKPHSQVKNVTIGVWDTVNAVGAPANWIRTSFVPAWTHDRMVELLPGKSSQARQALAIDDERSTFNPLFWREGETKSPDDRIVQVWFAGMHANVGGGYPKDGLAYVSLKWMISEIGRIDAKQQRSALQFLPRSLSDIACKANAHDKMYDSRAALAVYYRYSPRNILTIVNRGNQAYRDWLETGFIAQEEKKNDAPSALTFPTIADEVDHLIKHKNLTLPVIHSSAIDRLLAHTQSYLPITIPTQFRVWSDSLSRRGEKTVLEDNCQAIEPEATIERIELKQHVLENPDKDIQYWVNQIGRQKSMRGIIWSVFALLSSYLFFAPIFENVWQFFCNLFKDGAGASQVTSLVAKTDGPLDWFIPDIAKPWVDWIILHHPMTTVCLLLMTALYWANRHYKSSQRLTGYFYWKHLPEKTSDVSTQKIEDSMLMKTQNMDTPAQQDKDKTGILNRFPIPEKISKNVEQLGQSVSSGSSTQFRKLTRAVKRLNGTDY